MPSAWRSPAISETGGPPRVDLIGDSATLAMGLAGAGLTLTWMTGRGGYLGGPGRLVATWTPQAVLLALVSLGAAIAWFGIAGGVAVVVAVMWHEWGHVIAYRVAGHTDARFRLIPLFGGVAISDQRPKNQAAACFVTLMGPGFSVSLVALLALAEAYLDAAGSSLARVAGMAATLTGAINAFNMLPLWPLDGGRALRAITVTAAPGLAQGLTVAMSLGLAALALIKQMWFVLIVALMGLGYARQAAAADAGLAPMTAGQAALAVVGYLAILGAHALAGLPLVLRLLRL